MSISDLPTLNACLNSACALLLLGGYISARRGNRRVHKRFMIAALATSIMFLASYVIYHANAGSVPYTKKDWTRPLYFAVLVPHVILAAVQVPFIIALVWHAWHESFDRHKRLAHWIWPVWMFVSVSGVVTTSKGCPRVPIP